MRRKLLSLTAAFLLLSSWAASAFARENRILVFVEEGSGFAVEENGLRGGEGSLRCLTSGDKERFERLAPLFLGQEEAPQTEQVPVMPAEEDS